MCSTVRVTRDLRDFVSLTSMTGKLLSNKMDG